MAVPYLIEAMVQHQGDKLSPYYKMAYIDENPNVDLHMQYLVADGFNVASVKSRPAADVELAEFMYDKQGNTNCIDGVPVDGEGIGDVVTDSVTDTDTGGA